jgi:glycogen debranching enzyme
VRRERVVRDAVFERLTLTNYNRAPVACDLTIEMAVDFADIFLVRGFAGGPRVERLNRSIIGVIG